MIVDKDGRVFGSVDVSQLAALYAQADDEELRAHYRQVAAENGSVLEEPQATEAEKVVPDESAGAAALRVYQQSAGSEKSLLGLESVDVQAPAEEVADSGPYDGWSLAELQEEAAARGLAKSGNKADLAERLTADDAAPEPEEE